MLYNVAVKNGCNMSWSQFTNFTGSVLCLDFSTDIGLMSDESAGILGNYQLGLTAQFTNTRSTSITPTLYVVVVYEGVFNVVDGNCSHMIGVLSRQDVLESQRVHGITYKSAESIYGGDFYHKLKGFAGKAHDFIKKNKLVSKLASSIPHPYAQAISHAARSAGYGMSGAGLAGGKLTKEELKRRLQERGHDNDSKQHDQESIIDEDDNESSDNE